MLFPILSVFGSFRLSTGSLDSDRHRINNALPRGKGHRRFPQHQNNPMNIIAVGSGISSMPWTIAPNSFMGSVLSVLLYIGFLAYVWFCFKAEQTELYIFTVTKGDRPTLYWSTMGIMSVLAVIFGFYLMKNLYPSFSK